MQLGKQTSCLQRHSQQHRVLCCRSAPAPPLRRRATRIAAAANADAATAAAAPPAGPGRRPRIAMTLGDPAGIGPEIALKTLADPEIAAAADVTVFGCRALLERARAELAEAQRLHAAQPRKHHPQHHGEQQQQQQHALPRVEELSLRDVPLPDWVLPGVVPHLATNASGEASFRFLEAAVTETLAGGRALLCVRGGGVERGDDGERGQGGVELALPLVRAAKRQHRGAMPTNHPTHRNPGA